MKLDASYVINVRVTERELSLKVELLLSNKTLLKVLCCRELSVVNLPLF